MTAACCLILCLLPATGFTDTRIVPEQIPDSEQSLLPERPSRIYFGLLSGTPKSQASWQQIIAESPDIFVHTGNNHPDTLYSSDDRVDGLVNDATDLPATGSATMDGQQKKNSGFTDFAKTVPVIATWGAQDYGSVQGASFTLKESAKSVFLELLREPSTSPRYKKAGIYHSYHFSNGLQIILLDLHYFRTDTVLIGQTQWQWLERELIKPASVKLLVSSEPVFGKMQRQGLWGRFPKSLTRLEKLIDQYQVDNLIILSSISNCVESDCLTALHPSAETTHTSTTVPVTEICCSGIIELMQHGTESIVTISLDGYQNDTRIQHSLLFE